MFQTAMAFWTVLYASCLLTLFPRVTTLSIGRRQVLLQTVSSVPAFLASQSTFAADETASSFQLEVTITLPSNVDREELLGPDTALYVTARPTENSAADQVWKGRRVPPVLTTRVAKPSDLRTVLTEKDATPEGMTWDGWKTGPLVVSARLDTDGIASTRNSTDLVGQGSVAAKQSTVTIPLQGRGLAGKILTGR